MPRYFFHVINGSFVPDHTGTECSTLDDVKTAAVKAAGAMLDDQGLQLWETRHWDMYVCDEQNRTRLRLAFTAENLTSDGRSPVS